MSPPTSAHLLAHLAANPLVAVVRLPTLEAALPLARALVAGGVGAIEITLTSGGALAAIEQIAALPEVIDSGVLVGAGTVLDEEGARATIAAGAHFVVSPVTDAATMRACAAEGVPWIPGALTPTELFGAWRAGATLVKLFPAGTMGPAYLRDLLAPLPELKIMVTGGVGPNNAADFIRAGAVAVGIGSSLVEPRLVARGEWETLTERARRLVATIAEGRRAP